MKFLIAPLAIVLAACAGCSKASVGAPIPTNNPELELELLFEHDGCKVYRFYDSGHSRYWSDCRGRVHGGYNQSCGKGCTRFEPDEVETSQ